MKKLIIAAAILFSITIKAQNPVNSKTPARFEYGILAGVSTAAMQYLNSSFLAEGRYSLNENWGLKISVGYSRINKDEDYNVKTFNHVKYDDIDEYKTVSYKVEKSDYSILPVSVGIEYKMNFEKASPYCSLEFGGNSYRLTPKRGSMEYGTAGTFSTYAQLPEEYKTVETATYKGLSYRIGFCLGLRYSLFESFKFDVRYLYQVNTSLTNNHLLLFGVTI